MSKGWRVAIVVLLAIAIVGVLGLKAERNGRDAIVAEQEAVEQQGSETGILHMEPEEARVEDMLSEREIEPETPVKAQEEKASRKVESDVAVSKEVTSKRETAAPEEQPAKSEPRADAPAQIAEEPEQRKLPRLVDVGSDKCVPCLMMAPILEELSRQYKGRLEVVFIDMGKKPDEARAYKVRVIPTQIFYDADGKEVARHQGFMSKEDILATFEKHGIKF